MTFQLNKPQRCCGFHACVRATGPDVQDPRPPARPDTPHRGAGPPGTSPGSLSAAQTPGWRWPAPLPHSRTPAAAAIPAACNTQSPVCGVFSHGGMPLHLTTCCVFVHLVAVHHVSEAGQRMDPYVHVLVLNSSHWELQSCGQVAAAGRQLHGKNKNTKIFNPSSECLSYSTIIITFRQTFL